MAIKANDYTNLHDDLARFSKQISFSRHIQSKLRFVTAVSEWRMHLTNHSKHNNQKSTSIYHHPAGSQSNTKEVGGPTP